MSNKKNKVNIPKQINRKEIGQDFSFRTHHHNIKATQDAYEYYENNKPTNLQIFDSELYIALDTNFILDLYALCHKEREQFLKFIETNAKRIVTTHQVEYEYTKHRNDHLGNYEKAIKNIKDSAKTAVQDAKDALKKAALRFRQLSRDTKVRKDMSEVIPLITPIADFIDSVDLPADYSTKLDNLYEPLRDKLTDTIEKLRPKYISETNDMVLKSMSKSLILESLNDSELLFLQEHYQSLLNNFNANKNTGSIENYRFPGVGDRGKQKQNKDPYGDFIIYHELLTFIQQKKKDLVLLTSDVSKSDWVKTDKSQYEQQIIDTYLHTGYMLYIYYIGDVLPSILEGIEKFGEDSLDDDFTPEEDAKEVDSEESEPSPAVVDKTNEELDNKTNDEVPKLSYLRDISKERFIQELKEAEFWTNMYVDGYVSERFFVYNWIGRKHFHYNSSKVMLQQLVESGDINEYQRDVDGEQIKCIKL